MAGDQPYNEKELLLLVAAGDRPAFRSLHDRYWNELYHIALGFLKSPEWAQDVIQDVFIKIWEKRSALPEVEQFKAFLFITTRNALISAIRQKLRVDGLMTRYRQSLPDQFMLPGQPLAYKELETLLREAVRQLPEQQQQIFLMTREGGLSHTEIADQLGLARKTVANTITKALNFLRNYLAVHGADTLTILLLLVTTSDRYGSAWPIH